MNKEYIKALEDSNSTKADRIDRLGEIVERLVKEKNALILQLAQAQDMTIPKLEEEVYALRNLVKTQNATIENLQSKIDEADLVIKNAKRYCKLRDLEWDSDSHPELWDALNLCPENPEKLDKAIDETFN